MPPTPALASVDTGTVRHRFNFDWATSSPMEDVDTYWWWARSVRVDPNEVWADDDEGGLWVIPFTTDGADEITFGEPVRSIEVAVPVAAGAGASATAAVDRRRQRVLAANLSRPSKPATTEHPRASTGPQGQEEAVMPDLTALRAEYGIADDISDDDIADVLRELATPPEDSGDPAAENPPVEEPAPDPVPVAASAADPETVALRSTVDSLLAREQERATREASETREAVLSAAVREGRITPHERAEIWEPFYDAKPETATERLSKLPANRHHMVEVGHTGGSDTDPEAAAFAARRARLTGKES